MILIIAAAVTEVDAAYERHILRRVISMTDNEELLMMRTEPAGDSPATTDRSPGRAAVALHVDPM